MAIFTIIYDSPSPSLKIDLINNKHEIHHCFKPFLENTLRPFEYLDKIYQDLTYFEKVLKGHNDMIIIDALSAEIGKIKGLKFRVKEMIRHNLS